MRVSRENEIDFRQLALLVTVVLIGAILTWSATRESVRSAEDEARARFESTAALYVNRLGSELNHGLAAASDMFRYYQRFEGFDYRTFDSLVAASSSLNSRRKLVGVIIAIKDPTSAQFTAFGRSKNAGHFDLKLPPDFVGGSDGANRAFPLLYTWSADPEISTNWLGANLGAYPPLNAFFEETLMKGEPAGVPLAWVGNREHSCVLLAVPFHSRENDADGLVIQIIDMPAFLKSVLADGSVPLNVGFQSSWGGNKFQQSLNILQSPSPSHGTQQGLDNNWNSLRKMRVGSQEWNVTPWAPYSDFRIDYGAAVITSSVSLLLTGLVVFIVWSQSQRSKRVIEIVNRRTRALKDAHEELEQHYKLLQNLNRDVEESRRAAETANRAKSEFLATMSHELRTPLNAILGFSQLLQEQALGPIGDQRYVDYSRDINSSGTHLLSIINDILDLAKLEAGKINIEHKVLSTRLLVERVVSLLSQQANAKGIVLQTEFADNMPDRIFGDELRLRQILINLASNSIKFTNSGTVTVRLHTRPFPTGQSGWILEVQDTGIGIPDDKQATLFDRFTQVDTALSRRHGGVGLGLAICRELVERMEGKISVRSMMAVGTTIRAHLPLEEAGIDDDDDGMI